MNLFNVTGKMPDKLDYQGQLPTQGLNNIPLRKLSESPHSSEADIRGPLTHVEVHKARQRHGINTVETGRKRSWYQLLYGALCHPFNILLILLAITSGATEEYKTMGIMFAMVLLSTLLRFHQEYKSEIAVKSLLKFVTTKVLVIRNDVLQVKDIEISVASSELVPGDWIKLFPGELVPADVKIIDSKDFHVSQAVLTGEAIPVQKYINHLEARSTTSISTTSDYHSSTESLTGYNKTGMRSNSSAPFPTKKMSSFRKFFRSIFGLPVYSEQNITDAEAGLMVSDLDKPELCFMGSAVVSGTATCRVVYTGSKTHFGKMATELARRRPQNAFQLGVRRISWIFFITMLCLVPPVLLLQGFIVKDWYAAFIFALSVAVGLTPEMLPMIVNTTLSKGALEMSRRHCIVKKLDAIINMGGIDVLCTDKTGTLTNSIVTLHRYVNRQGASSSAPLFLGYLNAHFQSVQQNPLDSAIVSYIDTVVKRGSISVERASRRAIAAVSKRENPMFSGLAAKFSHLDELPFDFVRRRMSVILKEAGGEHHADNIILICKGAVEEVIGQCTRILDDTETTNVYSVIRNEVATYPMTTSVQNELLLLNEQLSKDGLRVVAVAYKNMGSTSDHFRVEDEDDMTFVGYLAFLDPPKESSREAIKALLEHNVKVKVLTGDSPLVCKKICREIGLSVDTIVTGKDLVGVPQEKLGKLVEEATIFAKLTPIQKSDVVRALKKNGHIVGFLGDGINDAPALTEADVGISVDSGTDICKESADIILLEKNLNVVVDAVLTGRMTYGNTLKYIVMAVSSNFGNVFSILAASAWLPFQPMGSLHILTQNLLYDISQIAIPWDHMDPEFLLVPHSWSMKSVLKFMSNYYTSCIF
ncbi:Magnesium-transporting ATPase, P-type 1 [Orchesella cincta]|uniref:Magnesium-transporting ATPase, P-type 1 n=1 Tax=Orchesella cincta TaxID=48709 RepID=A0A1D2MDJ4_ORCCI|nr:Magnesium-transporting ATPase, P-type 1 [Orchesella cincta]